jgi:tetratricopeptide (TPR) repeat protein
MRSLFGVSLALSCAVLLWAADTQTGNTKPDKQQRNKAINDALVAKNFDKALGLLEKMGNDKQATCDEKFLSLYYQFKIQAEQKHDGVKASALAKKVSETMCGCQTTLNYLAWTILDTPDLQNRDLDLALDLAKKAAQICKSEDCQILDTLARAYFEKGDLDKAIEVQTMAVEKCPLKKTLEKYKATKSARKSNSGKRQVAAAGK